MKKGKPKNARHPFMPPPVRDRRIIVIDDAPLRAKATADYKKAMAKLDKSCADQRRFEQKDKPGFDLWMAEKFGPIVTDLRANEQLIHQQQELIDEVEEELFWGNHRNPQKAYAAVMKAREHPEPIESEDDSFHEPADKKKRGESAAGFNPFEEYNPNASEAEIKKHFNDFIKETFGFDPRHLNKAEYAEGFAGFKARFFNATTAPEPHSKSESRAEKTRLTRVKEIYRILVRRLHPDLKAKRDVKVSTLWHEIQEAYHARNLERLETLLAVTEMQEGRNANIRLSQMQGALIEIKRTLRAVQSSLGLAKKDPAWGFSLSENHDLLENRLRREMETNLANQKWLLKGLKETLDCWSGASEERNPTKKSSPQKKQSVDKKKTKFSKKSTESSSSGQTEFFSF